MGNRVTISFGDVVTFLDKDGREWKYHGTIIAPQDDFARPKVRKGDKLLVFRKVEPEELLGLDKLFE